MVHNLKTPEPFLARWSRLRREATRSVEPPEVSAEKPGEVESAPSVVDALPPVEDLDASSDFTAFMRSGVPEDVRRLALRKAWSTDAAISHFRTFADYDWDFNAPGYGALDPLDRAAEVARMLSGFVGEEDENDPAPSLPPADEPLLMSSSEPPLSSPASEAREGDPEMVDHKAQPRSAS